MRIRNITLIAIVFTVCFIAPYIGAVDLQTNLVAHGFYTAIFTMAAIVLTDLTPSSEREARRIRGWSTYPEAIKDVLMLTFVLTAWLGLGPLMYLLWFLPAYWHGSLWAAIGLSVFTRICQITAIRVMHW